MPVGGGKTDLQKKRSQKKKAVKKKSKSKQQTIDKNVAINPTKQNDLNKTAQENLTTLRWDTPLTDPILENDRIEQYKELRRQRYTDARQQAIQNLVEKLKIGKSNK